MFFPFLKYCLFTLNFVFMCAVSFSAEPGKNLFTDADFRSSVRLEAIPAPLASAVDLGILNFNPDTENQSQNTPFWTAAAHYSRYCLSDSPAFWDERYGYGYRTEGEAVFVRREGDETILRLEVNAEKQYEHPRRLNEPWPHLLIEHNFDSSEQIPLTGENLIFSFDVRICRWKNQMAEEEYQPSLHCVQTNAYFIIRNVNPDSPDYNDYIWFGVPVFDSRYTVLSPYQALDGDPNVLGTGKLIYTLGGETAYQIIYNGDNPASGGWCHGSLNLAAEGENALIAAQKMGIMTHTALNDLAVVHFNFGWEVPGTFSAAMEIKNLSLTRTPEIPDAK